MTHRPVKALFVGGGTGGHLRPALTLAHGLKGKDPETRCLFLLSGRDVEKDFFVEESFDVHALFPGWTTRPPWTHPGAYVSAFRRARRLRREFDPDITICTGGYVSLFARAGLARRHPLVVCEPNAVVGRAIRWLMGRADGLLLSFGNVMTQHRTKARVIVGGLPTETRFFDQDRTTARRALGLDPGAPTLAVLGGSLGASAINEMMVDVYPRLLDALPDCQVVHVTGRRDAGSMDYSHPRVTFLGFSTELEKIYAAADLAVCRSGGMTVSELSASGTPSVLIPYPHHKDRHQFANARQLQDVGAAIVFEQSRGSKELHDVLASLLVKPNELDTMGEMARDLADRDHLDRAVNMIMALARGETGFCHDPISKTVVISL